MVNLRSVLLFVLALLAPAIATAEEPLAPEQARIEILLDAPDARPFERQMLLATIRGVYFVPITLEEMTVPRMRDVEWVQLARDVWSEQMVDGRPARVLERRIAFFPQRAGQVTIRPVLHRLQILDARGRRVWREARSAPVEITARPGLAAEGSWWLPVSALEYSDRWDKDAGALQDGDSARRTVILRALGATAQMLPPQPPMREPWLITFAPPETRTTELTPLGPLTTVVWTWNLRPKTGEPGVLPAAPIPWYDTGVGAPRTAVLEAAPFGYASFGDNAAIHWRSGFKRSWVLIAGLLAGMVPTCLWLAPGGRMRSRAEMRAWVARRLPDPDLAAMRRAARRGKPADMRRAAMLAAARRGQEADESFLRALAPLDRRLFGRPDASKPLDLRALATSLAKALTRV